MFCRVILRNQLECIYLSVYVLGWSGQTSDNCPPPPSLRGVYKQSLVNGRRDDLLPQPDQRPTHETELTPVLQTRAKNTFVLQFILLEVHFAFEGTHVSRNLSRHLLVYSRGQITVERGHTLYFPAKPEKENRKFCIFNWGKIVMNLPKRTQLNRRESLGKALIKLWVLLKNYYESSGQRL